MWLGKIEQLPTQVLDRNSGTPPKCALEHWLGGTKPLVVIFIVMWLFVCLNSPIVAISIVVAEEQMLMNDYVFQVSLPGNGWST